jgi:hypothetical protein
MQEMPSPTMLPLPVQLPQGSTHHNSSGNVPAKRGGISVEWARHQDAVREAQRLRYLVFAGASTTTAST